MAQSNKTTEKLVWLTALDDPVAGLKTFAGGLDLGNLDGNGGTAQLVVVDLGSKLKVFADVALASEHVLLEPPVGVAVHYIDEAVPRVPAVAVATPTCVYLYRGATLKPFARFALPATPVHEREAEIWQSLAAGTCDASIAQTRLRDLRQRGLALTQRSAELTEAETSIAAAEIAARYAMEPMPRAVRSCITCMATLPRQRDDPLAAACIVLGTEAGQLLVLAPGATSVLQKVVSLRAAPLAIACSGMLESESCKIVVACRNRCVYVLRGNAATTTATTDGNNGSSGGAMYELESQVVSIALVGHHVYVGCMDNTIQAFSMRGTGRRLFSLYMPCNILVLEPLVHSLTGSKALIASLANGEVRVYSDSSSSINPPSSPPSSSSTPQQTVVATKQQLLGTLKLASPAIAMRFGQYGRERGVLVAVCQNGALAVRVLSRASSDLSALGGVTGPPPEQEVPLRVPKKTSLYVEQAQHERDHSADMHRAFQRDLYRLRLTTARAYVRVMTDQQGPVSHYAGSALRLSARVQGLGPTFRLRLLIENTGRRAIRTVPIVLSFNPVTYRVSRPHSELPILVPGLPYHFDTKIVCLDERGATGESITVLVCTADSTLPVIMAVVQMPAATELLFN